MCEMSMRDKILMSPAGQRMANMVTPIYDRSYVGLWLFEVMGREYDHIQELLNTYPEQIAPDSATWAMDFWERMYGITPDPAKELSKRRAALSAKILERGSFTPEKLKTLSESITGMDVRVQERTGPNTFSVYLSAMTGDDQALKDEVSRIKPAHMTFELHYEQGVSTVLYWGAAGRFSIEYKIRQVNR